jgi:predicted DNA-binding transcriptional regulator YafY
MFDSGEIREHESAKGETMRELDRILGILLLLQSGRATSAKRLAERFGVSTRTIYRDLRTMSLLGIPVYAERGRKGGIRLLEGYFLPPLMFSRDEAIALLLGLIVVRSLRAAPFQEAMETAAHKLLAAVPDHLRQILARLDRIVGVERSYRDIFHAERGETVERDERRPEHVERESAIITRFLHALLDQNTVRLSYHSPYRGSDSAVAFPSGLFWDRDRWYLVGQSSGEAPPSGSRRLWRADRVTEISGGQRARDKSAEPSDFNIGVMLEHAWLKDAMNAWRTEAPVRLRITPEQARWLQQDWYYRFAQFENEGEDSVLMAFGEGDRHLVFALLRWLGPGAELLSPVAWREAFADEIRSMLAPYDGQFWPRCSRKGCTQRLQG